MLRIPCRRPVRLFAFLLFAMAVTSRAADWQLQREGSPLSPVRATLKGDRLYYALPDIFQPLGGSVERDPITRQFVALLAGRRVQLDPQRPLFTIEMKTYVLTAMPIEKDKTAWLPLDFYEQALPVLTGETLTPDAARAVLTLKTIAARPQPVKDATTPAAPGSCRRTSSACTPRGSPRSAPASGPTRTWRSRSPRGRNGSRSR